MKKLIILFASAFLVACGGGDSDSGSMIDNTLPGSNVPVNFVGTYVGTANITASALGLSESDTFDVTITVTADGMVRFDGDDPDETFTVGLQNDGVFAGTLPITEDECQGSVSIAGTVDGMTASGDVSGDGQCDVNGLTVDAMLSGSFNATR